MSGFSNTQYTGTINSLISASESKLINNPYYKFSDKKPTPVIYYKQNIKKSTLDCASELQYAHVSNQSALKYNKIINFVLYGIDRMTTDYDVTENGVESSPISGDAIVLPNTIEPLPGDFFSIPQIKEDVLFKVDGVTPDTLDTGANLYKIEYHLELVKESNQIEDQVVNTFRFLEGYVGTEYSCLITDEDYNLGSKLEQLSNDLCMYFNNIFYNSRVQTYTYYYTGADDANKKGLSSGGVLDSGGFRFYDPYMIEFIRRNKIITNNGEFEYIAHQTTLDRTFPYEYSRSFFNALENKDINCIGDNIYVTANLITQINSLFTARLEDYYQLKIMDNSPYKTKVQIFDPELISAIKNNKKFTSGSMKTIYNMIVSYMNNEEGYIDESIIEEVHKMDLTDNKICFYMIPFYIFIIRNYISSNILSPQTIE